MEVNNSDLKVMRKRNQVSESSPSWNSRLTEGQMLREILGEERVEDESYPNDEHGSPHSDDTSLRTRSRSSAFIDNGDNGGGRHVSDSGSGGRVDGKESTEADAFFISENNSDKDNPRPTGANRVIRDRVSDRDNNNRNSLPEGERAAETDAKSKVESTFANVHRQNSQSQPTTHLPNFNLNSPHQRASPSRRNIMHNKQHTFDDSNVQRSHELDSDNIVANSQSQVKFDQIMVDGDGDSLPLNPPNPRYSNNPVRQNFNLHQSTKATGMSVRCHCNLASCVTNNYMCKSERRLTEDGKALEAGCFVQELESESSSAATVSSSSSKSSSQSSQHGVSVPVWNGRVATARRGCVEFLTRETQEQCSDTAGNSVQCCTQDMCNYPKSFYPSSIQQSFNNNRLSFDSSSSGGMRGGSGAAGMTPNLDHQVWLRAAVIAVPICGLMILVVLIIVARRLLRSDEDYKDPDGRRNRRKFSSPYYYHQQPQQQQHHPQHLSYHPPSIHESPRGLPFGPDSSFHVKPVYMETSEYLLPQDEHYCSNCQQTDNTQNSCLNSHHQRSTSSSSHYPSGGGSNSAFNFASWKTTNRNSETEELVNSRSNNSSSGNSSQSCSCTGHGVCGGGTHDGTCNGLDGRHSFSTCDDTTPTSIFSSSSLRPQALFSGSSPELPALHQGKRFSFLSKIGLSKSIECESNSSNSRPFNV